MNCKTIEYPARNKILLHHVEEVHLSDFLGDRILDHSALQDKSVVFLMEGDGLLPGFADGLSLPEGEYTLIEATLDDGNRFYVVPGNLENVKSVLQECSE
jgi:hypothetical protein